MEHISFVVPVYNGSATVKELCERLVALGDTLGSYEIIFVDDGSKDASLEVLHHLQKKIRNVVVVQLSRNFGQHSATLAGLAQIRGDIAITLDQDMQNPPEEIRRLLAKLAEGYDVVYGLPEERAHNVFRNLSSEFSKWISRRILSTALKGNFSSFRALRRWVADEISRYDSYYLFIDGLISWTTANVAGIMVRNDRTEHGSQYTFLKLVNHGLNLLVNFSIRPLQIASIVGAISATLGLIAAGFVILEKLLYDIPVQGWTSLMVAVLVIGGMQIAFLGLLGEYTGRILMNSNRSPKYIIRSIKRGASSRGKKHR